VDLVAIEAAEPAVVHNALREVIALHAVLVRASVRPEIEVLGAEFGFFQVPDFCEPLAGEKADRPVNVLSIDRQMRGSPLTVALDADIVSADKIERLRIDDAFCSWMRNVVAAGAVALLAADVPFRYLAGGEVVVYGMATVAGGAGGSMFVVFRVELRPSVCTARHMVGQPFSLLDVPLGREGKVAVAALCEIALLPAAPVDERDLAEIEGADRVRMGEIAKHGFGMNSRIANDVGHTRLLPSVVFLLVAPLTCVRTYEVRLLRRLLGRRRSKIEAERKNQSHGKESSHAVFPTRQAGEADLQDAIPILGGTD
jgi:hypothetical protein